MNMSKFQSISTSKMKMEIVIDVLLNHGNGIDVIDVHNLCIALQLKCKDMYTPFVINSIKNSYQEMDSLRASKADMTLKIDQLWYDWPYPTQPPYDFYDETYARDNIVDDIINAEQKIKSLYSILHIKPNTQKSI